MYGSYARRRDEKGLTDYRVCKETGIAPASMSDWKAGRTVPKADKLYAIARYLGCTIEDLLEEDTEVKA